MPIPANVKRFIGIRSGPAPRAVRAAIAFRDAAERELGVAVTRRRVHTVARSNTGVLGVYWSAFFSMYVAFYPVAPAAACASCSGPRRTLPRPTRWRSRRPPGGRTKSPNDLADGAPKAPQPAAARRVR